MTKWEEIKKKHNFKEATYEQLKDMSEKELEEYRKQYREAMFELENLVHREIHNFLKNQKIIRYSQYKEDVGFIEFPRYLDRTLNTQEWLALVIPFIKLMKELGYKDYRISDNTINVQFDVSYDKFVEEWNKEHPEHPI